jgi:D-amino-acid dehydrogenase
MAEDWTETGLDHARLHIPVSNSAIVLGAGMVGVGIAVHLRRRGFDVVLVDRQGPGEGTSFGNAGLIQREAVFPHGFPRTVGQLQRIARNRSIDAVYHPQALPGLASPLFKYWWHSEPERYRHAVQGHSALIATCLDEHMALARDAGATDLLRPIGYHRVFGDPQAFAAALEEAEVARREHGVNSVALNADELAAAEPHLTPGKIGAIHWTDPYSVSDPHGLTTAYARLFVKEGGTMAIGDATTLERTASGWRVQTADGPVEAAQVVVALGPSSGKVTKPLGYDPPLFGKRGYHMHYKLRGNAILHRPFVDNDHGFLLTPMRYGIRLTTGAEFAREDAPATPIQLERAEPIARALFPLADRVDAAPWMGVRPATPDMLPIIGKLPGQDAAWCAFGHAHQGLTLGPTTGHLLADMMTGAAPFLDPAPYRPDRF